MNPAEEELRIEELKIRQQEAIEREERELEYAD